MYNNSHLVLKLGNNLVAPSPRQSSPRATLPSLPCLTDRLPSSSFIRREAEKLAPQAILASLRRSPSPPEVQSPYHDDDDDRRSSFASSIGSSSEGASSPKSFFASPKKNKTSSPWKDPQPFEVFRAVEKKDLMFLMEIRDRHFELLLRKSGDATPLTHAMRCGPSHKDVQVVLLGAFSRYINHIEDSDMSKPRTKVILKALRANLKIAIDFGLASNSNDLIASFLQTLIMSEGDKWIWAQVSTISLALRSGTQPVRTAEEAVRKFATRELGKADLIGAVGDYIANATSDLLMLGAWSCVLDSVEGVKGAQIPTHFFARDDRVYKSFVDRLDANEAAIRVRCSKRLKWQLRVLRVGLEGRQKGYRNKVELLACELDEGQGP